MTFRFVHTADIHLDSPLRSLALRNAELARAIGTATRESFARTVTLCLDEKVDALLLSGDLYDGDQTSMKTARFLAEQLGRLDEAGIRSFIIRGNHDALSKITRELELPDSVYRFGGRAEAVPVERAARQRHVVVHGLSFRDAHAPESLLPRYKPPVEGAHNIGLMHTSLDGVAGHDPYAPCSLADLQASGFRYWALGHIHKRFQAEGATTVVMPGIPQGRHVNEAGPKSVSLVTLDDDGGCRVEERSTAIAQFERIEVDAAVVEAWGDLVAILGGALRQAKETVTADELVARVRLVGETPLAWRIRRDLDQLTEEAGLRADAIGGTWLEALESACCPPGESAADSDSPVVELQRLIETDVASSEAFRVQASAVARELSERLPADCRHLLGSDEAEFQEAVAALAREGAEEVAARLHTRATDAED